MAYDIFISYRRKDCDGLTSGTNIARTIKQQLEIEGYKNRVFFDYSELSDDDFEKIILKAIAGCKVFVLVLSKDSMMRCVNDDDWVRREICHAQANGLKIIPIEPDNLFNGYPDKFPAELEVVKRIQHTTIHMDSSFERDMQAMIEARIRPILTEGGVETVRGAIVKIDSDLECRVLDFGEMVGTIGKGINEIRLPKGNHELSFVGVESDAERFDYGELDIRDLEYITRIKVCLLDQYNARKAEEKRQEEERRRLAAENYSIALRHHQAKNYPEAVKWFRKAAESGHSEAQYYLGCCYDSGQGVDQDYALAVEWFRKAAEQGDADAQYNLGCCYYSGEGVDQDYALAVEWYRKAAEQGNADAQCFLGHCYASGQGVGQDYALAVEWYRKAAEQGHSEAQYSLGWCYDSGQGVDQDDALAVEWYRKAADQGDADAQCDLGHCYASGQGVDQDWEEAVKWNGKAAEQGHSDAKSKAVEYETQRLAEQENRLSGKVKGRDGVYKVGDYYDDGKKQGVVFEVTADGKHGKIVSLTESKRLQWSSDKIEQKRLIGADDKHNGANNMSKVQKIVGWRERYPAFAWCADLGEGWYLPAIEELKKFTLDDAVHDAVNSTLAVKGKELKNKDDWEWYWSSTEYDDSCAWYVLMDVGSTYDCGKYNDLYVRAVSAF